MTIETKEFKINKGLKRKVEMVWRFVNVKYTIINGNIKSIKNTNIAMVKIKDINYLAFDDCNDIFINGYKDLENEKRNIQVEVRKLEYQNEKLQEENNRLHNFLHNILQTLKKFFHRLLKIGTEKDKNEVISEIKEYHKQDLYDNFDLHDIADNTSKEEEINDYLYKKIMNMMIKILTFKKRATARSIKLKFHFSNTLRYWQSQ